MRNRYAEITSGKTHGLVDFKDDFLRSEKKTLYVVFSYTINLIQGPAMDVS